MSINHILFIDIETVSQDEFLQPDNSLFMKRFRKEIEEEYGGQSLETLPYPQIIANKIYLDKAPLVAEFGKIVSISIGRKTATKFFVKNFSGRNEKKLLNDLKDSLTNNPPTTFCAHNGKEFDYPYLMRRMIINDIAVPPLLNVVGKKPWDIMLEDTMQMWSGTQWNYKVSLELLCNVLGVESPKGEITGKDVSDIYYGMFEGSTEELPFDKEEAALKQIGRYNSKDVVATAQCYLRMKGEPLLKPEQIEFV